MTSLQSEFLRTVQDRGFLRQCTDLKKLDSALSEGTPRSGYIGFDCTASSLHVGSLLQIMLLRWFQRSGHRPIVLIGGGTTRIGDPSGKDEARKLLDDETIAANSAGIRSIFERFLDFGDGPGQAIIVDNHSWLGDLNHVAFLRNVGRHFSVNRMLSHDSVKTRLDREQPFSFLEFNYMVLQAHDFVELARKEKCILQMGGSDQWGNIVNGVELGRRTSAEGEEIPPLFGLTSPLITTSTGEKMGKTTRGAVWMNAKMLSPYDYWQFWRNTNDADVGRFLRLFTELPLNEIDRLAALKGNEINDAKTALANEVTTMAHGADAAQRAAKTAQATFTRGEAGEDLPVIKVSRKELEEGIPAFRLFARDKFLVATNGEARRLIQGGGARINGEAIDDENRPVGVNDLLNGDQIRLSAGRKRHAVVRPA